MSWFLFYFFYDCPFIMCPAIFSLQFFKVSFYITMSPTGKGVLFLLISSFQALIEYLL